MNRDIIYILELYLSFICIWLLLPKALICSSEARWWCKLSASNTEALLFVNCFIFLFLVCISLAKMSISHCMGMIFLMWFITVVMKNNWYKLFPGQITAASVKVKYQIGSVHISPSANCNQGLPPRGSLYIDFSLNRTLCRGATFISRLEKERFFSSLAY